MIDIPWSVWVCVVKYLQDNAFKLLAVIHADVLPSKVTGSILILCGFEWSSGGYHIPG